MPVIIHYQWSEKRAYPVIPVPALISACGVSWGKRMQFMIEVPYLHMNMDHLWVQCPSFVGKEEKKTAHPPC